MCSGDEELLREAEIHERAKIRAGGHLQKRDLPERQLGRSSRREWPVLRIQIDEHADLVAGLRSLRDLASEEQKHRILGPRALGRLRKKCPRRSETPDHQSRELADEILERHHGVVSDHKPTSPLVHLQRCLIPFASWRL